MNVPTVIILVVIAALLGLAIWRMVKKRSTCGCGDCEQGCTSCAGHKPGGHAAS